MEKLNILYEDNHVIVVVKPVNIPSQADKSGDIDMLSIIKDYLVKKYNKPGNAYLGLVHRLDRPTGGIMVFAKTSKSASRLSEQVRTHHIKKSYLAIVDGKFDMTNKENIVYDSSKNEQIPKLYSKQGTFVDYLLKNQKNNISRVVDKNTKNAKEAILDYEIIKYNSEIDMSVAKINLRTGRHHQIRVQFSSRGHSLNGDQKYGIRGRGKQLCLWEYRLEFIHPTTKEKLSFEFYPEPIGSWTILNDEYFFID